MFQKSKLRSWITVTRVLQDTEKLKEEFVVLRFRDFHSYDSSFNLLSNPMQINIYGTTLVPGDIYIPSSTCTYSSV